MNLESADHLVVFSFGAHTGLPGRIGGLEYVAGLVFSKDPAVQNVFFSEAVDGNISILEDKHRRYYTQDPERSKRSWLTAALQSRYLTTFGKEANEEEIKKHRRWHINRANETTIEGFASGEMLLVDRLGREFELLYTHEAYPDDISTTIYKSFTNLFHSWDEIFDLAGKGEIDKATPQVKDVVKKESVLYDFREARVGSQLTDLLIQAQQPTNILVRMGSIHNRVINKFGQYLLERASGLRIGIKADFEEGEMLTTYYKDIWDELALHPELEISDEMARRLLLERIIEASIAEKVIPGGVMNALSHFIGQGIKDEVIESLLRSYPELGANGTGNRIIDIYGTSA